MFTRQDYMNGVCTHQEYYRQYVTPEVLQLVRTSIGTDDEHFNDIPLVMWDRIHPAIMRLCSGKSKTLQEGGWSMSASVCTAKQAAAIIKEEESNVDLDLSPTGDHIQARGVEKSFELAWNGAAKKPLIERLLGLAWGYSDARMHYAEKDALFLISLAQCLEL